MSDDHGPPAAQVLPADVGHRLPPWFFLMPSYWRDPKLDYVDEKLLAHLLAAGEQKVRASCRHPASMCCTSWPRLHAHV